MILKFIDAENGNTGNDPLQFRECGKFDFAIDDIDDHVYTIVCQKCIPIGKYVTVQSGAQTLLHFAEIAIFGIKRSTLVLKKDPGHESQINSGFKEKSVRQIWF